jgi:hypothetical protein
LALGLLLTTGNLPAQAATPTPTPPPGVNRLKPTTDVGAHLIGITPTAVPQEPLSHNIANAVNPAQVGGTPTVANVRKLPPAGAAPGISVAQLNLLDHATGLSAVFEPSANQQLEVFAATSDGTLKDVWKAHDGPWARAFSVTGPGFATGNGQVAAVWQPLNEHLEVFGVDPKSGAINDVWKAHDAAWQPVFPVSGPNFASPGAQPSAVWQPLNEHLEVFATDAQGAIADAWKAHDGAWQTISIGGAGFAQASPGVPLGATVSAVWQPLEEHLEVFGVDATNAIRVEWKQHDGQPYYNRLGELATNGNPGGWENPGAITKANLGPAIFVDPLAPGCTGFFRMWRAGYDDDDLLNRCNDFFGITAWCNSQGSDHYLATTSPPQSESRIEVCAQQGAPLGDALEQTKFLVTAIAQAVLTAMPFVDDVVQGTLCLESTLFACATLAANGAQQANLVDEGVAHDAIDLTGKIGDCADGDIVACAQAGLKGTSDVASAAKVKIPGVDAASAAVDCANNQDFDSCVQLGVMAADAAGVPSGASQAAANVNGCINGDTGACIALGQQAAQAGGLPTGGLPNGGSLVQGCSQGDVVSCTQLGQALVTATS